MQIAVDHGWHTGSRSDDTISAAHRPLYLLDVHWTDYDWADHLAVARAERPGLAAVPDILTVATLPAVLAQAEEIAPYCQSVCIIPKARVVHLLPRCIGGTPVVLGYSVPTKYGATPLPLWDFQGWPVHLLGGTPRRQIDIARYLAVVSADGNMAQKLANRGLIFDAKCHGVHMDTVDSGRSSNLPARALAVSLANIAALWRQAGHTVEERGAVDNG